MVAALVLRFGFPYLGLRWLYIAAIGLFIAALAFGIVAMGRVDLRFPAALLSSELVLAALLVVLTAQKVALARPALAVVGLGIAVALAVGWKRLSRFK